MLIFEVVFAKPQDVVFLLREVAYHQLQFNAKDVTLMPFLRLYDLLLLLGDLVHFALKAALPAPAGLQKLEEASDESR